MTSKITKVLSSQAADIEEAAVILNGGGLVAFPTETVYGLGADARDDTAVAQIYAAKGRPSFNPLIVHVKNLDAAQTFVDFNETALSLASAFWPGALTLVLPLRAGAGISKLVTAGLDSLAVRVPDHPIGQALLAASDAPISAPSANPSGRVSPTTADHVVSGLSGRIDAVVDGGACTVGLESTIVACLDRPTLLRAGGIPREAIEACLGQPLAISDQSESPIAPGQLVSHYAPSGTLRLNARDLEKGETLLGFGAVDTDYNLSASGDLIEAAANLFDHLHQLDAAGVEKIAVSPIPHIGLGAAINDRLRRAAAPRD